MPSGSTSWQNSQTGEPIPPGIEVFDMSKQEGGPGDFSATTANNTEANRLAATIAGVENAVTNYENLLKDNPGIAGTPGSVIGVLQNAVQTLSEIGQAFGDKMPDDAVTIDEIRGTLEQFAPNYDPNIQRARTNLAELAYGWAQLQNPTGEVSRQAYERSVEALRGGLFSNNASALAGMSGLRDAIANARIRVDRLRNPQADAPAPAAPAPPQLVPGSRPRAVNPQTGAVVEWDGSAWVPAQ
jgi:hypothetical protein